MWCTVQFCSVAYVFLLKKIIFSNIYKTLHNIHKLFFTLYTMYMTFVFAVSDLCCPLWLLEQIHYANWA